MSSRNLNVLETSRTSSKLIAIASALLVLLVFAMGASFAQIAGQPQRDGSIDPESPGLSCAAQVLPHFPLQAGNQWNYSKQGSFDAEPWQVAVVTRTSDAASELLGYFGATHTVCAGTGGVIHEVTAETGDEMWYDLGATVGTGWQMHLDPSPDTLGCVDGSKVTIASRTEHVTVPAGSFDNVIRLDYTSPCVDAGILSEWFAPGVGLVKRTEQSFAGPVTSELQSAIVGGILYPAPAVTTTLAVDKSTYAIATSLIPSEDVAPSMTANLVLRNAAATAGRFDFIGCASMTVSLIDKSGKALVTTRATDGTDCKGSAMVTVEVGSSPLALPISIPLLWKGGRLPAGRYLVVATLDTIDAAPLRPSASSVIDIQYFLSVN